MKLINLFFAFLFLNPFSLSAKEREYSLFASSAAWQGAFTLGASISKSFYGAEASVGYSPEILTGRTIWQINFKPYLEWEKEAYGKPLFIKVATGILYGIHKNLFLKLPEQYPRKYYTPSALRYLFGMELGTRAYSGKVYFQYYFLDTELATQINNEPKHISLIGTYGISYHYLFPLKKNEK